MQSAQGSQILQYTVHFLSLFNIALFSWAFFELYARRQTAMGILWVLVTATVVFAINLLLVPLAIIYEVNTATELAALVFSPVYTFNAVGVWGCLLYEKASVLLSSCLVALYEMAPTAPGGKDLSSLISSMSPTLDPSTYQFATISPSKSSAALKALTGQAYLFEMLFREAEGWTVIARASILAPLEVETAFACRKITLNVHSSLEAVGFIAAVGKRLTEIGVGVNPVSGYYHDHLFVPEGREDDVLAALKEMAEEAKEG